MPIESATYISDLNSSNPPDADPVGQADDHIRLIKATIKATFPNVTAPVTATAIQLNSSIPVGLIGDWYGTVATIPSGWALCNGQTVARSDGSGNITTPNLVDKFVLSCGGGSFAPGAVGGALTHAHALTIAGFALTTNELPNHSHGVNDSGHGHGVTDPGHAHTFQEQPFASGPAAIENIPFAGGPTTITTSVNVTGLTVNNAASNISIQATGSGNAHGHAGSTSDTQSNLPPYYALVAIMKI